jgi:hypothetical protein
MKNASKGFENWKSVMRLTDASAAGGIWGVLQDDWDFHKTHHADRVPGGFENCSLDDLEFTSHRRKDYLLARPAGTQIPFHVWRGALQGFEAK